MWKGLTNRERAMAVLNYESYDRLPVVHFGFWTETLEKWAAEGHLSPEELQGVYDGSPAENVIAANLGFDFNWYTTFGANSGLFPHFDREIIEETDDGFRKVVSPTGVIILEREGAGSIPAEVDYLLKSRQEWEEHYLPRLQFSPERINWEALARLKETEPKRTDPLGLHLGSLYGNIRNWLTVVGSSYLQVDDEPLFDEIIDTVGNLCFQCAEAILNVGAPFDFAHFWEDICFKSGPLIDPRKFEAKVGPHYRRLTELVNSHGIHIISLDCDGWIDKLIPTWINNGVNTMFPIEVGTWGGNLIPWRETYGRELRGVGGTNKNVFSKDRTAVDAEIKRLRTIIELGGFLPCPDHRIAPDAEWDNVVYYCQRLREEF